MPDAELDTLLAGAAGVRDADLPALPEDFLPLLTRPEPASVVAARQLVSDAYDARTTGRRRRPGRKAVVRAAVAVVAVAAAWTTAVLVAPQDAGTTPDRTASPTPPATGSVEPPANGITLVAAQQVTFPLSLDPAPEGLTPTFSRFGGTPYYGDQPLVFTADYASEGGDRVLLELFPADPRRLPDVGWSEQGRAAGTATVDGAQAEVRRGDGVASLLWERPDGRWVWLLGEGAHAQPEALGAVADSIVDRPQPVGLQFGLAPAGWSVSGYEESRSLDLTSDTAPQQQPLRLSVFGPGPGLTVDSRFDGMSLAGPVQQVTIQGLAGRMALAQGDVGSSDYWFVVGQLPAGRFFLLLAPEILTQDQVLQIAEQVTYTP